MALDAPPDESFEEFAATRDPALRDRLIEANLRLATYLARRFAHKGEALDDLEQVAAMALVKAVDRFDPTRDVTFSTFATRTIVGELKRHFRDRAWSMRPPRRLQELCIELNREIETMTHKLGRAPTVRELAVELSTSEDEVIEAMEAAQSYRTTSIDVPVGEGETLGATLGSSDAGFDDAEWRAEIGPLVASLPERQQLILRLRFVEDLTQSEIADRVGLSQMHVSRLLRASLNALRDAYRERMGDPDLDLHRRSEP
jgi:RNA polymerase sigma-B factor